MLRSNSCFNFPSGKCLANNMRNQIANAIKIKKAKGFTSKAIANEVCSGVMPKV